MPKTKRRAPRIRSWKTYLPILVIGALVLFQTPIKNLLISHYSQPHQIEDYNFTDGGYDNQNTQAVWMGKTTNSKQYPTSQLAQATNTNPDSQVLGARISGKHIEVDLTTQKLYAYNGQELVHEFPISSGLYDWTPNGTFWIWYKIKYTRMEGGNPALGTYYNLPNVPFTMFFYNNEIPKSRGYGLHGAYWHNDFGIPKSHGCINLRPEDAETLFYWTMPDTADKSALFTSEDNPGTPIHIYGKYEG